MNVIHRTLLTFGVFVINYYLVASAYQYSSSSGDELQLKLFFSCFVFFIMLSVSLYQKDPSYLFGSMALLYTPFIIMKKGFVASSAISTASTAVMIFALLGFRIPILPDWLSIRRLGSGLKGIKSAITGNYEKNRIISRIRKIAEVKDGGKNLSDAELLEFISLEKSVDKVVKFFDGSDPSLEMALADTVGQIQSLTKDHARLLLRSCHLKDFLESVDRSFLEKEVLDISTEITETKDIVVKSQLEETILMKRKSLEELEKLVVCQQRIKAQRLQILEIVRGTHDKLHSLKYTDIQTLQNSSNSISKGIRQVRQGLDDLESGLLVAESLGK